MMQELPTSAALQVLEDRSGAVEFGWIAPRVAYARFSGPLSAELGSSFVYQLERLIRAERYLAYFSDARALTAYDLIARTRFQRLLVTERARFTSVTMLTWSGGIGPAARAFAAALGVGAEMLANTDEFERRLSLAAPDWRRPKSAAACRSSLLVGDARQSAFVGQKREPAAWGDVAPAGRVSSLPRRT
jgi:hypothetical protein